MKKLIIIPAYNESACIQATIEDIKKKAPDWDYLVVNDCSTDRTEEILSENDYHYISLPTNLGIGGVVQTGFRYAVNHGYDMAVQVDGDGQHDVSYLNRMMETMIEQDADLVIGSRFINKEGFQSGAVRRVGIRWFSWLISFLGHQKITDPTSGFRLLNRKSLKWFAKDYPRDYPEPETVMTMLKRGKKVVEVPVEMRARQGGQSSIRIKSAVYYMIKVTLAILIDWVHKFWEK